MQIHFPPTGIGLNNSLVYLYTWHIISIKHTVWNNIALNSLNRVHFDFGVSFFGGGGAGENVMKMERLSAILK